MPRKKNKRIPASARKKADPFAWLRRVAEAHFGEPVTHIDAPGGTSRASLRLIFGDRSVIATDRDNKTRTQLEAVVLSELSPVCDAVPKFLGFREGVLFQSDVGSRRLNLLIDEVDPQTREDLADTAVEAIFRIQSAARGLGAAFRAPPLGSTTVWVDGLLEEVALLDRFATSNTRPFDRAAAAEALMVPPMQFVKWDCRSGNAAMGDDGQIRWFDFEYCGMRHGAEDLAWLIGDESWPVPAPTMLEIVADNFRDQGTGDLDAYLTYLSLYTPFHCLQRLALILRTVESRGWRSKARVRERDGVGANPDFAAQLCDNAAFFAERHPLARPLVGQLERAARFLREEVSADID